MPISVVYGVLYALASFGLLLTWANGREEQPTIKSVEALQDFRRVELMRGLARTFGILLLMVSIGAMIGLCFR